MRGDLHVRFLAGVLTEERSALLPDSSDPHMVPISGGVLTEGSAPTRLRSTTKVQRFLRIIEKRIRKIRKEAEEGESTLPSDEPFPSRVCTN